MYVMVCGASGDLTGAKGGAETVLSLTGRHRVKAHVVVKARVGPELGVSEWRLLTRERLDAFAQVAGEERPVHLDAEC